jgi:glycosyltransferase involved in cell wall biosynthesis
MKILIVCHNHAKIRPGGAEGYALDLYEHLREQDGFSPLLLARVAPSKQAGSRHMEGRPIKQVTDDPNQYLFFTDPEQHDFLFGKTRNKAELTRFYRDFLLAHKPDVVHFQGTLFLGYDIIRVTRDALPQAAIVYTLHEYLPICYRDGQMVRTRSNELCREESPRRCHECFPEVSEQDFFIRKSFIQSHFALVDRFIAPTPYVLEQYAKWGIARERLLLESQGIVRPPSHASLMKRPAEPDRARNRFGFFGQLTAYKGVDVLLRAIDVLGDDFDGHLWIHGANLEHAKPEFRAELRELLERTTDKVTFAGRYERHELPELMARTDWVVIPSIWWETGPLTVSEAFMHDRPVICSNIGGMSERVEDDVSGLHFRRADAHDLAEVLSRAASNRSLWDRLRAGIPDVHWMEEHADNLTRLYEQLLLERSAPAGADNGGTGDSGGRALQSA